MVLNLVGTTDMTAEQERAAVVAWLRGHAAKRLASSKRVPIGGEAHWYHLSMSAELTGYADAIKRGEHLRGGE